MAVVGAQAGPLYYGYAAPSLVAAPGSNSLPVATSPLLATTGYAVGASGAIGGQAGLVTVLGRRRREASASVSAVPVVSLPAEATAGYAVGASGAVGGQEGVELPKLAVAAAPVLSYAALPVTHALGYAGLPYLG